MRKAHLKSPFEAKEKQTIKLKDSIQSADKKVFYPKQPQVDPDGI